MKLFTGCQIRGCALPPFGKLLVLPPLPVIRVISRGHVIIPEWPVVCHPRSLFAFSYAAFRLRILSCLAALIKATIAPVPGL